MKSRAIRGLVGSGVCLAVYDDGWWSGYVGEPRRPPDHLTAAQRTAWSLAWYVGRRERVERAEERTLGKEPRR